MYEIVASFAFFAKSKFGRKEQNRLLLYWWAFDKKFLKETLDAKANLVVKRHHELEKRDQFLIESFLAFSTCLDLDAKKTLMLFSEKSCSTKSFWKLLTGTLMKELIQVVTKKIEFHLAEMALLLQGQTCNFLRSRNEKIVHLSLVR